MSQIIISTTFREFDGSQNDRMQRKFLHSLRKQTFQDFILVATVFNEKRVEKVVKEVLSDKAVFVHDCGSERYKFSLSKTFINGVDYGLLNNARVIVDCSSDIVLQNNFLEVVNKRTGAYTAGISHPNVFIERACNGKIKYSFGKLNKGIDIRFFSLDIFKEKHVHDLLKRYPSYDYGAGIEMMLCGVAIKYASKKCNIFMESKVLKQENDRKGQSEVEKNFFKKGYLINLPTVERFMRSERISDKYLRLYEINRSYKVTKYNWLYRLMFGMQFLRYDVEKVTCSG